MNSKPYTIICTAGLVIDAQTGNLRGKNGIQQRLSPVNMKVLQQLASNHGKVVSRMQIFEAVWPNQDISDDALTRCISDIRATLGKLSDETALIETIPKKGYRWLPPIILENESPNTSTRPLLNDLKSQALTWIKWLPLYILAALAMLTLSVWGFTTLAHQPNPNIAILRPVILSGQKNALADDYHNALFTLLVEYPNLEVLSQSATSLQNQDIYPSLYQRFGTRWTIEITIKEKEEGNIRVVTSLIDARNAFVIFRQVNTHKHTEHWTEEEANAFFNRAILLLTTNHVPET